MLDILLTTLSTIAFILAIKEICDFVRAMRYRQKQRRNSFDCYAFEFERDTQRYLRQLYYQADMENKYND